MITLKNTKTVNDNDFETKRPDLFSVLVTLHQSSSERLATLAHIENGSNDEMIENDREEAKLLDYQKEILATAGQGYIDTISEAIQVLDLWHLETSCNNDGNELTEKLVLNVRDFLKKQQEA